LDGEVSPLFFRSLGPAANAGSFVLEPSGAALWAQWRIFTLFFRSPRPAANAGYFVKLLTTNKTWTEHENELERSGVLV
jgi:hypothetical protein